MMSNEERLVYMVTNRPQFRDDGEGCSGGSDGDHIVTLGPAHEGADWSNVMRAAARI